MLKKHLGFIISINIFLWDLIVKRIIKFSFKLGESKPVLGSFLKFTYIENSGIAFGLFAGSLADNFLLKNIIFTVFTLAALAFILYLIHKNSNTLMLVSLFMIFGGALGNVLERIFGNLFYYGQLKLFYGKVVDYIDVGIGEHRWPFFNIADCFITIGVIMLIIYTVFFENKKKKELLENAAE